MNSLGWLVRCHIFMELHLDLTVHQIYRKRELFFNSSAA